MLIKRNELVHGYLPTLQSLVSSRYKSIIIISLKGSN